MIRLSLSFFQRLFFFTFKKNSFLQKRKRVLKRKKKGKSEKSQSSTKKGEMIFMKDDKGIVCFTIQLESLFYIESDSNYISIFYASQGKMEKYLMRASLKTVLEENQNKNLVRCHHSYIVNFEKIKLYKKDKEGGMIELVNDSLPTIPVSKSHIENVLSKFQFQ